MCVSTCTHLHCFNKNALLDHWVIDPGFLLYHFVLIKQKLLDNYNSPEWKKKNYGQKEDIVSITSKSDLTKKEKKHSFVQESNFCPDLVVLTLYSLFPICSLHPNQRRQPEKKENTSNVWKRVKRKKN